MKPLKSKRGEVTAAARQAVELAGDSFFDILSQRDPDKAAFVADWIAKQPDPKPSFGAAFVRQVEISETPKSKRPALRARRVHAESPAQNLNCFDGTRTLLIARVDEGARAWCRSESWRIVSTRVCIRS